MLRLVFLLIPLLIVSGCTPHTKNIPPDAVIKENGRLTLARAALARTARLLMDGFVYLPKKSVIG